ncbi:hypothetical protein QUF80_12375 [Desulfococcaceae bacterium HSG8]|nr:hypothetical protein [Desulfococcaceae bacterium HSG8]
MMLAGDWQIPRTLHGSDLSIRTEQQGQQIGFIMIYDARGELANPPHLTWFRFVNPNRAAGATDRFYYDEFILKNH